MCVCVLSARGLWLISCASLRFFFLCLIHVLAERSLCFEFASHFSIAQSHALKLEIFSTLFYWCLMMNLPRFCVSSCVYFRPAQDAEGKKVQEELQIFEEVKFGINVIRRNVQMIEGLKTQSNRTFDQKVFQGNTICIRDDWMYFVLFIFLHTALISALVFTPSIQSSFAPPGSQKSNQRPLSHLAHTHISSPSQPLHHAQRS